MKQNVKVSWAKQAYQRSPWLRVRYGRRVRPPNQQSSNLDLDDTLVLQPRAEPVGRGVSFPLNTTAEFVNEDGYAKR